MSNKAAGAAIAVIGVILIAVGIGLYAYQETVLDLYYYEVVAYPYQGIGTLLLALGIIILVVGIIVTVIPGKASNTPQQAMYGAYGTPGSQVVYNVAPGTSVFCSWCGRPLSPGAPFCPGCGRKLS